MVLLSIFFTRIRSTEDHQQIILYSFCRSMPCSSSVVKILLQIFLYEDLSVSLTYICRLYFPQNTSRTALCYTTILLSENILIFDINHQQNTGRSDQIETIKTIMQTTRPRITWKVLPMAQLPFLENIRSSAKDLDCELFYSELKRHNVSHYITI